MGQRFVLTAQAHGFGQALLSLPRIFAANLVSLLAARRALATYLPTLRGERPRWDKTAHHFPESASP